MEGCRILWCIPLYIKKKIKKVNLMTDNLAELKSIVAYLQGLCDAVDTVGAELKSAQVANDKLRVEYEFLYKQVGLFYRQNKLNLDKKYSDSIKRYICKLNQNLDEQKSFTDYELRMLVLIGLSGVLYALYEYYNAIKKPSVDAYIYGENLLKTCVRRLKQDLPSVLDELNNKNDVSFKILLSMMIDYAGKNSVVGFKGLQKFFKNQTGVFDEFINARNLN